MFQFQSCARTQCAERSMRVSHLPEKCIFIDCDIVFLAEGKQRLCSSGVCRCRCQPKRRATSTAMDKVSPSVQLRSHQRNCQKRLASMQQQQHRIYYTPEAEAFARASPCHRTPNKFQFSRHRTKLKYTLVSTALPMPSDRCHYKARRHRCWCECIEAIAISYIIPSPSLCAIVTPIALRHIHCHFCESNLPDIDAMRCAAAREYQSRNNPIIIKKCHLLRVLPSSLSHSLSLSHFSIALILLNH